MTPTAQAGDIQLAALVALHPELTPSVVAGLADAGFRTLNDVLRQGGVPVKTVDAAAGQQPASIINAHAALSVLSPDLDVNAEIIKRGFTSITAIASTPLVSFASTVGPAVGRTEAEQVHGIAVSFARLAVNRAVQGSTAWGGTALAPTANPVPTNPTWCHCPDCASATSPLAYLADLLDYTVHHVLLSGTAVDVPTLEDLFGQGFGSLPASCGAVNDEVAQVRISVEVLRHYQNLATLPPAIERAYCSLAYQSILGSLGTSYEELAQARTATADQRKLLGQRLGITLSANRPDELDSLVVDASVLDEPSLASLFGLQPTDGSAGPVTPMLAQWRTSALRATWMATDHPAIPQFDDPPLILPDVIGVPDIVDPWPGHTPYALWELRRQFVDDHLKALQGVAGGLSGMVLHEGFPSASFLISIDDSRAAGNDITDTVRHMCFSLQAFERLAALCRLDAAGISLLDSELADAGAILTQRAEVLQHYPAWRLEESNSNVYVGPEFFRIPSSVTGSGPATAPPRWLATLAQRRAWDQRLAERIAESKAASDSLQMAVRTAEAASLPVLRDALVQLANPSDPIDTSASKLQDRLLIDCSMVGSELTTRVTQAVQTLQSLVTALRAGALGPNAPALSLVTDQTFDEEWAWMGTYATWRAAMLVFIYPENFLLPSIKKTMSPVLRQIIQQTQGRVDLTPDGARQLAAEYTLYLRDVISLQLHTSCTAYAAAQLQALQLGQAARRLTYLFAVSNSQRAYWAAYDPTNNAAAFATMWTALPGLGRVNRLLGAVPYSSPDGHFIYLYASVDQGGSAQSGYLTLDLDSSTLVPGAFIQIQDPTQILLCTTAEYSVPAQTESGHGWICSASDQVITADIDGDGIKEIIIWAGNSIAVLREQDGALVVAWRADGTIPGLLGQDWSIGPSDRWLGVDLDNDHRDELVVSNGVAVGLLRARNDAQGAPQTWHVYQKSVPYGGGGSGPAAVAWTIGTNDRMLGADMVHDGNARIIVHSGSALGVLMQDASRNLACMANFQGKLPDINLPPWDWTFVADDRLVAIDLEGNGVQRLIITRGGQDSMYRAPDEVAVLTELWWPGVFWFSYHSWGKNIPGDHYQDFGVGFVESVLPNPNGAAAALLTLPFMDVAGTGGGGVYWAPTQHYVLTFDVPSQTLHSKAIDAGANNLGQQQHLLNDHVIVAKNVGFIDVLDSRHLTQGTEFVQIGVAPLSNRSMTFDWFTDRTSPQINAPGYTASMPGAPAPANAWVFSKASVTDDTWLASDIDGDGHDEVIVRSATGRIGVLKALARSAPQEQITPRIDPSVQLIDVTTDAARDAYRQLVATAVSTNSGAPAWVWAYLAEAFYLLPVHLALQLQTSRQFRSALDWFRIVYDYARPEAMRAIWPPLALGASGGILPRPEDWLLDPLDPHSIAATRPGTYTRFTLLAIIQCLLDYADTEFSAETAETVEEARLLYLTALRLLSSQALQQSQVDCEDLIGLLHIQIDDPQWEHVWLDLVAQARTIADRTTLASVVDKMQKAMTNGGSLPIRIADAHDALQQVQPPANPTVAQMLEDSHALQDGWTSSLITDLSLATATANGAKASGVPSTLVNGGSMPASDPATTPHEPAVATGEALQTSSAGVRFLEEPGWVRSIGPLGLRPVPRLPQPSFTFCVPANGIKRRLKLRAQTALFRIRHGLNIAGTVRPASADLTVGPVSPPTQYRFSALIDRAKQLTQLAGQFEMAMQNAMEKSYQAQRDLLTARQNIELCSAKLTVALAQVQEAILGIDLAQRQRTRAAVQAETYQSWIDGGLSAGESASIAAFALAGVASVYELNFAGAVTALGQVAGATASYERRAQEWQLQLAVAQQDMAIGSAQVAIASAQAAITNDNRAVAALEIDHAQAFYNFLSTKGLTAEVWAWMTAILADVYRFFLSQATAVAQIAASELAFERQETLPPFIQNDYWEAQPSASPPALSTSNQIPSGLTGSARLTRDIFQLDQYAFDTNQRKLQLSKTISLAELDPFGLQQFRQSGVLNFSTPSKAFDQDFPGHYLRLIRRVRTSVVALIPPTAGIRATLSSGGISRVVVDEQGTTVVMNRRPQSVALSAPVDATGLFELDIQPELLLPFEDMSVDTSWHLVLPKAANRFDYGTIADILFTIEYTALASEQYGEVVKKQLDSTLSADRGFSFRYDLPDQWYALNNPTQTPAPMVVTISISEQDFPPNLADMTISQLVLALILADGASVGVPLTVSLQLGGGGKLTATTPDTLISTRRPSGQPWQPLVSQSPKGDWHVYLDEPQTMAALTALLQSSKLTDILLIITYSARTPTWP